MISMPLLCSTSWQDLKMLATEQEIGSIPISSSKNCQVRLLTGNWWRVRFSVFGPNSEGRGNSFAPFGPGENFAARPNKISSRRDGARGKLQPVHAPRPQRSRRRHAGEDSESKTACRKAAKKNDDKNKKKDDNTKQQQQKKKLQEAGKGANAVGKKQDTTKYIGYKYRDRSGRRGQ
uniref:Uncharacterized protein n=1 Tax=Oryza brachyantha TaxID=4533 RepID=J3MW21_ORYBR